MAQEAGKTVHEAVSLDENGVFSIDTGPLPVPSKIRVIQGEGEDGEGEDKEEITYYPQLYPQHIYHTGQPTMNTGSIEFRRVIGMTQSTGQVAASSDAYIHNLAFNNGSRWLWRSDTSQYWSTGTHAYQPAADNEGRGKTVDGIYYPLFMVDSEKPWQRLPDGNPRPDDAPDVEPGTNVHSRYFQEGVSVNLLAPAGQIMADVPVIGTHRKK
jgi:hypothetical protein